MDVRKKTRTTRSQAKKVKPPAAKKSKSTARVGEQIPDLSLVGTAGDIRLSDLKGKKVVLYFYPRDATPGCTIEGHDFSRLLGDFHAAGAEVFGVSRDTMKSHEKFKDCENYSIDLLSDEDEKVCKLF